MAKRNADRILGITPDAQNRDASRDQTRRESNEILTAKRSQQRRRRRRLTDGQNGRPGVLGGTPNKQEQHEIPEGILCCSGVNGLPLTLLAGIETSVMGGWCQAAQNHFSHQSPAAGTKLTVTAPIILFSGESPVSAACLSDASYTKSASA